MDNLTTGLRTYLRLLDKALDYNKDFSINGILSKDNNGDAMYIISILGSPNEEEGYDVNESIYFFSWENAEELKSKSDKCMEAWDRVLQEG